MQPTPRPTAEQIASAEVIADANSVGFVDAGQRQDWVLVYARIAADLEKQVNFYNRRNAK